MSLWTETYPPLINHFGLSSGKDSTALLEWAVLESGYPIETLRFSFSDTENEYDEVYEQIRRCNEFCIKHGAAPIKILHSEGFLNLVLRKKRFPSARVRFCTEVLKIIPMTHLIEEFWLFGCDVILHSGVRASESNERAAMDEWGTLHGCKVRRPLLKWTIADVWAAHRKAGLPINPLYFTGRRRVGCRLCCMSNKQDVRITAKTKPETIDIYEQWEKQVTANSGRDNPASFFHGTTVPKHLRSIKGLKRKTKSKSGNIGDEYSTVTIRDVVKWSMTLRGGKQLGMDFMFDDSPIFEQDDAHEPCKSGYCE